MRMAPPRTMFEKIWDAHVVTTRGSQSLIYVDRQIIHEGSFHAFIGMKDRGLKVRSPRQTLGTPDHYVPSHSRRASDAATAEIARMIETYDVNMREHGVANLGLDDHRQGIVHVVGPEQGWTLPGTVMLCNDSHTSTHGALGAWSFGVGQSELMHVLATQTIWQSRPATMRVTVDGPLAHGVSAKDVILAIIARIGAAGAVGHVVEYSGSTVSAMSVEARLTVCNMSIEAGARAGLIAPDDRVFDYLQGRPFAPREAAWDAALASWRRLPSDAGARFDRQVALAASSIAPMVTWGTSPEDALPIDARVPDPATANDAATREKITKALGYIGIAPGIALTEIPIDRVFIGSCTNSRIEDLRAAAAIARGRKAKVPSWVVAGSGLVKEAAEAEGLDRVFKDAGFEWREPGCSMCVGINGDIGKPGERIASTSNRNFEGRQGKGVRTHLMSPAMAVAAAVTGRLADVRKMM
jgi:3-isopropylmalate/(R)-2-methylmalate dehydratase large subunit